MYRKLLNISANSTQKVWKCMNKPVAFEIVCVQLLLCYSHRNNDQSHTVALECIVCTNLAALLTTFACCFHGFMICSYNCT